MWTSLDPTFTFGATPREAGPTKVRDGAASISEVVRLLTRADVHDFDELVRRAHDARRSGAGPQAFELHEAAFARVGAEGTAVQAADILRELAYLHQERGGDLEAAGDLLEASLAIAEACGLPLQVAHALNGLGILQYMSGHVAAAEAFYERARVVAESAKDERLLAILDTNLAVIANIRGDVGSALMRYGGALMRYRTVGDKLNASRVLSNIAKAHIDLGEWSAAATQLSEAFRLAEELQDLRHLGTIECVRADLLRKQLKLPEAKACCDRALAVLSRLGAKDLTAEVYRLYGLIHRDASEPHLAEARFALALTLAEEMANLLLIAEVESERAPLLLAAGREQEALVSLNRAYRLFCEAGARREIADLEQRLDALEQAYVAGAAEWGASIDAIDEYSPGHCQRVARDAVALAEAVGVRGRALHWIRLGAYLHDVGKTAVPVEVLTKRGPLSDAERSLVMEHARAGAAIVTGLKFPDDVRPMVRSHHERWDGTGYPDHLANSAIPLSARLLAVASVYNALTSDRSFRSALSRERALRVISGEAGGALDPDLVRVFLEAVQVDATAMTADGAAGRASSGGQTLEQRLRYALREAYSVRHELPVGGMSRLYLARDAMLGRDVVIKVLPPELISTISRSRFRQEMELAARLQHPHILPVLSAGSVDDILYYVMPFVEGESLRRRLERDGPAPIDEASRLLLELTSALAYAHARDILHRDIKPENILLQGAHAALVDFGIARVIHPVAPQERWTETGVALGTPAYMAPEQIAGDRDLDARADLYSLALVGYEMLAGAHPFAGMQGVGMLNAHLVTEPAPLSDLRADLSVELAAVVHKALAKSPHDRFQSAVEFGLAIERARPALGRLA